jgi:hypothetical protein
MTVRADASAGWTGPRLIPATRAYQRAFHIDISGGIYMFPNDLRSVPMIGRAIPRVGVSLAFAVSLFGVGAGQLVVQAETPALTNAADMDGSRVPYIVCGIDTFLDSGGSQSILVTSGGVPVTPAQIDPAAIGQTFTIHAPSVARCGGSYAFQGVADQTANAGPVILPASLAWLDGDRAGPVGGEMQTLNCDGRSTLGCTMLVPVATGSDGGRLRVVAWAVMQVSMTGANSHSGRLLR